MDVPNHKQDEVTKIEMGPIRLGMSSLVRLIINTAQAGLLQWLWPSVVGSIRKRKMSSHVLVSGGAKTTLTELSHASSNYACMRPALVSLAR